jgi:hypothetical protein
VIQSIKEPTISPFFFVIIIIIIIIITPTAFCTFFPPQEVRLGTRDTGALKKLFRTRGPPHPALAAAGIDAEDESDAAGKLYKKATALLKSSEGRAAARNGSSSFGAGAAENAEAEAEARAMMAEAAALLAKEEAAGGHAGGGGGSEAARLLRLKLAEAAARGDLDLSEQKLRSVPGAVADVAPSLTSLALRRNELTSMDTDGGDAEAAEEPPPAEEHAHFLGSATKLTVLDGGCRSTKVFE